MPRYLPAGSGEKMQYLVHEYNDNTIRFVLRYPGLLQPDALRRAAEALVCSVDVLHASFQPGRISARWQVNETYDDCCFQHVYTTGDPVAQALVFALLPVTADSKTQLRCTLLQNERESALAVNLSHLCVDGGDGKYLLEKLAEGYSMILQDGSCEGFVVKNGSRAAEQVYEGLSFREIRSLLKDPRTGVKSAFPFATSEEGVPRVVRRAIPAEIMAAARQRAKHCGATANDLLLAACYHAYGAVPGVDARAPMSITSMMDLRRHCKDQVSAGLSNLSGSLSTLRKDGVSGSFAETLADIAAQTRRAKADPLAGLYGMPLLHGATRVLPMGLLQLAAARVYGSMSVGLTNLGNIDCRTLRMGELRPNEGWFGGPLKKKPAVQVSAASFDGACSLCIVGSYTEEDAVVLQGMLDHMAESIYNFAVKDE